MLLTYAVTGAVGCSMVLDRVLLDELCAACCADMYAWNCCGVTTFSGKASCVVKAAQLLQRR